MERNQKIVLAAGLLVCAALFIIVDIYAALIALVLVLVLSMSLFIMHDSQLTPDLGLRLTEDAKGVRVKNKGNAGAFNIHVVLVPYNLEFDIPSLKVEEEATYQAPSMMNEVKAVVTYQNENMARYSKTVTLSALGPDENDLLKPMFAIFHWK